MIAKIEESFAAIVCVGIVCVQCQPQKLDRKCSSVCNISKILSPQKNPYLRYSQQHSPTIGAHNACTQTYVHTRTHTRARTNTLMHTCTHTQAHTHTHTHMYTHTHTHTHTQTLHKFQTTSSNTQMFQNGGFISSVAISALDFR